MYDLPRQVYLLSIYVIAQQAPLAVVAFYLVSYGFCPKLFQLPLQNVCLILLFTEFKCVRFAGGAHPESVASFRYLHPGSTHFLPIMLFSLLQQ
jgi:hypothetical protein